jgi:hypothetical protein
MNPSWPEIDRNWPLLVSMALPSARATTAL